MGRVRCCLGLALGVGILVLPGFGGALVLLCSGTVAMATTPQPRHFGGRRHKLAQWRKGVAARGAGDEIVDPEKPGLLVRVGVRLGAALSAHLLARATCGGTSGTGSSGARRRQAQRQAQARRRDWRSGRDRRGLGRTGMRGASGIDRGGTHGGFLARRDEA